MTFADWEVLHKPRSTVKEVWKVEFWVVDVRIADHDLLNCVVIVDQETFDDANVRFFFVDVDDHVSDTSCKLCYLQSPQKHLLLNMAVIFLTMLIAHLVFDGLDGAWMQIVSTLKSPALYSVSIPKSH